MMRLSIIDIEQQLENDKNIIYLICRDAHGNKKALRDPLFKPYFYVLEEDLEKINDELYERATEKRYPTIYNKQARKLIFTSTQQANYLKRVLKKRHVLVLEGDLASTNDITLRYLIDRDIHSGIQLINNDFIPVDFSIPPRIWYIDIEAFSEDRSTTNPTADDPIHVIGIYDSYDKRYYILHDAPRHEIDSVFDDTDFKHYHNEQALLRAFVCLMQLKNPDIVTAWNLDEYDFPKLYWRLEKNNISPSMLSLQPFRTCLLEGFYRKVKGRVFLDLMEAYKYIFKESLLSHSLAYIASQMGLRKISLREPIYEVWKKAPERVLLYNRHDVFLLRNIDAHYKLISFLDELRRFTGCRWQDLMFPYKLDDIVMLRLFKNIVFLSEHAYRGRARLKGALVFPPKTGLWENVLFFDFTSQYPYIIKAFNISPDTLSLDGEIVIDEYSFTTAYKGILPQLVEYFMRLREEKRSLMERTDDEQEREILELQDRAIKACLNALYGATSYPRFRLYHPNLEVANAITAIGRKQLKYIARVARELGLEVLYGDTDGIFLHVARATDDLVQYALMIEKSLQESLMDFARQFNLTGNPFTIELKKIYSRLLLKTKKRYAGKVCWKKGRKVDYIEIVGLEPKRSDASEVERHCLLQCIKLILNDEIERARTLINEYRARLENHEFPPLSVAYPKGLRKTRYKVRADHWVASQYSNTYLNTYFTKGSKPRILPIDSSRVKGYPITWNNIKIKGIAIDEFTDIPNTFLDAIDWKRVIRRFNKKMNSLLEVIS